MLLMPQPSGKVDDRERAICARVQEFRQSIRWPQSAMAHELNISRDQLAGIEYGRSPLRLTTAARLCLVFDLSEYWLATGAGPRTPYGGSIRDIPTDLLSSKFSLVFDLHLKEHAKLASDVIVFTKSKAASEKFEIPPGFDPHQHLLQSVLTWMGKEVGLTDAEKARFAYEISGIGSVLAYRYKRERIKQQTRTKKKP